MRRPVIALVVVAAVVVAGLAGTYAYFFSGLRTAPRPLALASATPAPASSAPAGTASGADLTGRWTVAQGSQAGYRVKEVFAGQTSPHEAVARTSSVSGGLTVQRAASGLVAQDLRFAAQLAGLQSVDQVAGLNVSNRDRLVSRSLGVQQYPDAVFQAASAAVPDGVAGATVPLTVPGQLTIHGTTRSAEAHVQAHLNGSQLELAGTSDIVMTDYGVEPPQVPITTVQPQVTIEFQLVLTRSAA